MKLLLTVKVFLLVLLLHVCAYAGAVDTGEDTMLMFVGEKLSVVTAASRRPEKPSSAPAVVDVVTRETIERRGYRTLGELLSFESGFYISGAARGSIPYMRGLSRSILILYNGIPMPSGGTKTVYPLDRELSLDSVKQVEIIRGPGSVLWGSDAFAGIVNIVSKAGNDGRTGEVNVSAGSHDERSAYAGGTLKNRSMNLFLSAKRTSRSYHDTGYYDYAVDQDGAIVKTGRHAGDSDYHEVTARGEVNDWISFSGRFSDFTRRYTVQEESGLKWDGTKETPVSCIGISADRGVGKSHIEFSSYYQNMSFMLKDMNTEYQEDLDQYYAELLWDRRMFKKGLLTAGISYKESRVTGALAKGGFEPDQVLTPFPLFVQEVEQTEYDTRVRAGFVQYRHQLGRLGIWAGARLDDYSQFDTKVSWNTGINWNVAEHWQLKGVFGTGYRSPYSQQVHENGDTRTDQIDTCSFQVKWSPADRFEMDLTAFYSSVSGYVNSDPYAGVSEPSSGEIFGAELSADARFADTDLFVKLSAVDLDGDAYSFKVKDYTITNPDGTVTYFYDRWQKPFDTAPDFMAKTGVFRRLTKDVGLSATAVYTSPVQYAYSKDTYSGEYSDYWTVNTTIGIDDFLFDGARLTLGVKNLFDESYSYGGYYGSVPAPGRTCFFEWGFQW